MKRSIARRALALGVVLALVVFSALYLVSAVAFEVRTDLIIAITLVFSAVGFAAGLAGEKDEGLAGVGDAVADIVFGPEVSGE
jgi:hypothetical protein